MHRLFSRNPTRSHCFVACISIRKADLAKEYLQGPIHSSSFYLVREYTSTLLWFSLPLPLAAAVFHPHAQMWPFTLDGLTANRLVSDAHYCRYINRLIHHLFQQPPRLREKRRWRIEDGRDHCLWPKLLLTFNIHIFPPSDLETKSLVSSCSHLLPFITSRLRKLNYLFRYWVFPETFFL